MVLMINKRLDSHKKFLQTKKPKKHYKSKFITTKQCDKDLKRFLCVEGLVNKYWIKQMYTAALRLGMHIDEDSEVIRYSFSGKIVPTTNADQHSVNNAKYFGSLTINGRQFDNMFVAIKDNCKVVTFYPKATQTSAYKSSTNLLVSLYTEDVESGNTPDSEYSFKMVSTYYHDIYKTNPGINAQRVMNELYANSSDSVKQRIKDLESKLLIEALKNDNCNDKLTKAQKKLDDNHE
jgi:hypothetical protein